ncbi:hypothetical protein LguiA_035904 [Lonicera macranthoides]
MLRSVLRSGIGHLSLFPCGGTPSPLGRSHLVQSPTLRKESPFCFIQIQKERKERSLAGPPVEKRRLFLSRYSYRASLVDDSVSTIS